MLIETERLILRPITIDDATDIYEYAKNANVGKNAGFKPHENIEETKSVINDVLKVDNLAIVYKENNKVIGSIGISDPETAKYPSDLFGKEIGFVLSKDYWNKGIMTEAVREVIRYLLLDVKLDYIVGADYSDLDLKENQRSDLNENGEITNKIKDKEESFNSKDFSQIIDK